MVYVTALNTMKAFVRRGWCWGTGQELGGDKDNSLWLTRGLHVPSPTARPQLTTHLMAQARRGTAESTPQRFSARIVPTSSAVAGDGALRVPPGLHLGGKGSSGFNPSPLTQAKRGDEGGFLAGQSLPFPREPRKRVHGWGEILKVIQSPGSANTGLQAGKCHCPPRQQQPLFF